MEGSKEEKSAKEGFDRNVKRLTEQVKETYQRAFFDLLEEKVASDPPDHDWIVRLYTEIKVKLTSILKKGSTFTNEIEEGMDVELFDQMIRHKAFDAKNLYNLICFTFDVCKKLGSAGRDKETDQKMQEIIDLVNSGNGTFATIVPLYIKNINFCIDRIYEDLRGVSQMLKK